MYNKKDRKNHNLHVHSLAKIKIMKITNDDCIVNNLFIYKEKLCWIFFRSKKVFTACNYNFKQQAHSLKSYMHYGIQTNASASQSFSF